MADYANVLIFSDKSIETREDTDVKKLFKNKKLITSSTYDSIDIIEN
jgi:hypothetical protein